MKAFVTGGTGFIGSHLVDDLLEHSDYSEVKCLIRSDEKWLKGKPITKVKGDLHSVNAIRNALSDIDVVFHIAAIVKAPTQNEYDLANVDATETLLRIAEKEGVKKIVILSSLAASGPSNGAPKSEEDPMKPVSMYGKSKKKMEKSVHKIASDKLSVTILRPPAVYGPREDQIYTLFKMMNNRITPVVGNGSEPKLSLVYVKDVVQAIIKAAEQTEPGVNTYFVSSHITCWNEIKQISEIVLGKSTVQVKLKPNWVLKIAGLIETTATFFGTYPVVNREKANEMILEWTCSFDKAKKELGYEPEFTLEEGISRTLHWYKKEGWL